MNTNKSNKEIVLTFYKQVLGQCDTSLANELLTDNYIQHNPFVKTGKAGFMEAIEQLKKMPKSENTKSPLVRLLCEGDYVAAQLSIDVAGRKKCVIDLFRLQNGRLAEHWDAIEDEPGYSVNGHTMTDGSVQVEDYTLTEQNKKVVSAFYDRILIKQRPELLTAFVHNNLVQHHPDIGNGSEGLQTFLEKGAGNRSGLRVHRILGEGNFVVVQASGAMSQKPFVFYDIFRLTGRKIIEQWSVKQPIPEKMFHENGMI